jgi:glycerol-3-phosphate dehydrogenase
MTIDCDLLIVGGGINGAGIARDAAGRGLSVILCEKDDLASHTSSASTKLVHGGLRYLEHFEFGLVRKSLIEREVLMRSAPHIIWPLRFVMPHDRAQRPAWIIRAGLFLYDHLAPRTLLPASGSINLRRHPAGAALKASFTRGFMYSDGWVDDARLVVLNALDAAEKGAQILTHTACHAAQRHGDHWHATLRHADGTQRDVNARCLVNAAGPWAAQFLQRELRQSTSKALRLIKGSHIVVARLFEHPHAYIFQHHDGRIIFAIPYERNFTLIGTTDIDYHGPVNGVAIDPAEITYLCELASHYFRLPILPAQVVWSYSGVRPLVEDHTASASTSAAAVTRDYRLEFNAEGAALLSVFGGKITTFRKLAEEAVDLIAPVLRNHAGHWSATACLPGGDLFATPDNRAVREFDQFVQRKQDEFWWLDADLVQRYVRAYGTRIDRLLAGRTNLPSMGTQILSGLFEAEVTYLRQVEWATCAQDILWRRSKLGLHLPVDAVALLDSWLRQHPE